MSGVPATGSTVIVVAPPAREPAARHTASAAIAMTTLRRTGGRDPAVLLHLVYPYHVQHGVDEREVRERVREVAQVAAADRVEVLGVEPERARVRQQPLAQRARAIRL